MCVWPRPTKRVARGCLLALLCLLATTAQADDLLSELARLQREWRTSIAPITGGRSSSSPSFAELSGWSIRGQDGEAESELDDSPGGEEEEDDGIVTDRPDFTEASSTVGRNVTQIEIGYTYGYNDSPFDGTITHGHTYPEMLVRVGLTEKVELRFVWNYSVERVVDAGQTFSERGSDDVILGSKIGLGEQRGLRPEMAIILAASIPTGKHTLSNQEAMFISNLLYSWELSEKYSLAGSTGYRQEGSLVSDVPLIVDRANVFHQSVSLGVSLAEKVGMYVEYFGHFTFGAESNSPQNYLDGGFTYQPNKDSQFDIRFGKGLNNHADDFFAGVGYSRRFK